MPVCSANLPFHVFVRNDAVKKPLARPYEGPYPVLERQQHAYKIQLPNRTAYISIDRLKPAFYIPQEPHSANATQPTIPLASHTTQPTTKKNPQSTAHPTRKLATSDTPYVTRSGRTVKKVRFSVGGE